RLKKTHGEVAQEKLLVTAARMHLLKSVVENVDQLAVPLLHRDTDAFAEIFRVEGRPAAELTAAVARHAIDPEGKPNAVAEYEIDGALLEGLLRVVGRIECRNRGAGEEQLEVGLMPGAFSHADLLTLERLRTNVPEVAVLARDETRGRGVVAGGEVGLLERLGADADRGDG